MQRLSAHHLENQLLNHALYAIKVLSLRPKSAPQTLFRTEAHHLSVLIEVWIGLKCCKYLSLKLINRKLIISS